jgi:hypothetical protein
MEGTAEVPHPIADAHLPEAASVIDAAPALDTVRDMVAPQPTLVALLVRHVRLPRELLLQIEINSNMCSGFKQSWHWFRVMSEPHEEFGWTSRSCCRFALYGFTPAAQTHSD